MLETVERRYQPDDGEGGKVPGASDCAFSSGKMYAHGQASRGNIIDYRLSLGLGPTPFQSHAFSSSRGPFITRRSRISPG